MKKKELICVVCPSGCRLEADIVEGREIVVLEIRGNLCEKGIPWAEQELICPMRTLSSSIVVDGGNFPLVSVRTDSPIPLKAIFEVMKEVKAARVSAPVKIGDNLIKRPACTSCNIIATRNVDICGTSVSS